MSELTLREQEIQRKRNEILTYYGTDTGRVGLVNETVTDRVLEFEKDKFYFCNDYYSGVGGGSIEYNGNIVVGRNGKVISRSKKWEFELDSLYREVLKRKEAASLLFHWGFYFPEESLAVSDAKDMLKAQTAIKKEAKKRRKVMIPDLEERLEWRGKYFSAGEIVAKLNKYLYNKSDIWELPRERSVSPGESSVFKIKETCSGVKVLYDGEVVFKCNYLYDEITFVARDEFSRGLITRNDHAYYVELFNGGIWELKLDRITQ